MAAKSASQIDSKQPAISHHLTTPPGLLKTVVAPVRAWVSPSKDLCNCLVFGPSGEARDGRNRAAFRWSDVLRRSRRVLPQQDRGRRAEGRGGGHPRIREPTSRD